MFSQISLLSELKMFLTKNEILVNNFDNISLKIKWTVKKQNQFRWFVFYSLTSQFQNSHITNNKARYQPRSAMRVVHRERKEKKLHV